MSGRYLVLWLRCVLVGGRCPVCRQRYPRRTGGQARPCWTCSTNTDY